MRMLFTLSSASLSALLFFAIFVFASASYDRAPFATLNRFRWCTSSTLSHSLIEPTIASQLTRGAHTHFMIPPNPSRGIFAHQHSPSPSSFHHVVVGCIYCKRYVPFTDMYRRSYSWSSCSRLFLRVSSLSFVECRQRQICCRVFIRVCSSPIESACYAVFTYPVFRI